MYIDRTDLLSGIQENHLNNIADDDDKITTAINDAVDEVRGYLSARYDMTDEFGKTGTNRSTMVVKAVRNIAIYNLYSNSSPVNMPENRVKVYDDTVKWLQNVQNEKVSIKELERITDENGYSNYIKFGSNTKRNNHF